MDDGGGTGGGSFRVKHGSDAAEVTDVHEAGAGEVGDLTSTSSPSPTSSVPSSSGLRAAVWNARSLSNKFAFLGKTILDRNLDIFAVTETWHWGSDDVPLCRATPPGFTFCDRPRPLPLDVPPTQG